MFNKKNDKINIDIDKFDTIIGTNTTLEGNLNAQGSIRLDGSFSGKIVIDGHLYIGEKSIVNADIQTNSVIVSGILNGNVVATNYVRITSTGKIKGDISVKTLVIDEDAFYEGNCKMKSLGESE